MLIGHCKICRVAHSNTSCWIESFIICPSRRGHGLGRAFLEMIEQFAKSHGFSTVYLMTEDKEAFYRHLGYQRCQPICAITGSCLAPQLLHGSAPLINSQDPMSKSERTVQQNMNVPPSVMRNPQRNVNKAIPPPTLPPNITMNPELNVNSVTPSIMRNPELLNQQNVNNAIPPPPPAPPSVTVTSNIRGKPSVWMMKNIS